MADVPDCCKTGFLWDTEPRGTVETITVESYVSRPAVPTTKWIIILSDSFGHTLKNTRILADQFADAGFNVVVPDIFNGDALSPVGHDGLLDKPTGFTDGVSKAFRMLRAAPTFLPWLNKHKKETVVPIVLALLKELRGNLGATKIGTVGYCFGGRHAILTGNLESVDAFCAAHPSSVELAEVEAIDVKKPGLIALAEHDTVVPQKFVDKWDAIIKKRGCLIKSKIYPKTNHGFAVRGNEDVEEVRAARDECFLDFVAHMKTHLA
ncbi:hypothetical protein HK101_008031 [Irineochytrium annulatum]|nr:hypothetical protein HK101_008031 [Irineochytrium annulatum]